LIGTQEKQRGGRSFGRKKKGKTGRGSEERKVTFSDSQKEKRLPLLEKGGGGKPHKKGQQEGKAVVGKKKNWVYLEEPSAGRKRGEKGHARGLARDTKKKIRELKRLKGTQGERDKREERVPHDVEKREKKTHKPI